MNNLEKILNNERVEMVVENHQLLKELELTSLKRRGAESLAKVVVGNAGVNVDEFVKSLVDAYAGHLQDEHYLKMGIIASVIGNEALVEVLDSNRRYNIDWFLKTLVIN